MKKIVRLLTLGAIVTMLALPIIAKSLLTGPEVSIQDQCTQENKDAYYAAFLENRKTDQAKAYENAKKYLACPPGEVTEATTKIVDYLKKWVTAYEDATQKSKLPDLLYNKKAYKDAYQLGTELLRTDPENLKVLIDLGANGYLVANLKDPALNATALNSAKKAVVSLEGGKTVDDWQPFTGKDEALAYLNYTIGVFTIETDPAASLKNLIKAAQYETALKKSPQLYAYIGAAYEAGPYAKQSEAYKVYTGKDETPESKLALANINQVVDRMIDAYARAVALAGTDAKLVELKKGWMTSLSDWYKYRNKSDAGMNEMVASVLSKPLPPEPTPLTVLPASTPAATPASTSGATPASGATASTTAPAGQATTPPVTSGTTKPAAAKTATPAGPSKPKNNHP